MTSWLGWTRPRRPVIEDTRWCRLLDSSVLFEWMSPVRRERLREHAALFLADKRFHAAANHVVDPDQQIAIAALACIPLHRIGYRALRGWRDVIVYPSGFRSRREHHDEVTGVVTQIEDDMIGEAWDRGPIVLSWADIAHDLASPFDGLNVVIHEIAHKLDMLDGSINGTPKLPSSIPRKQWVATMQHAFDDMVRMVKEDIETPIDPYAAESVDEFFAVITEYHHSAPEQLARWMPDVAGLMDRYFGQVDGI
ncbi:MAG: M90 family metallopeptidase [Dokdonella sp.]